MVTVTVPARSRRADILDAAEREFATAGYSGGRVERIAAAAGVNKQLLFHYYGSKGGLFFSALNRMLARRESLAVSPSDHPTTEIRDVITSLQATVRAIPGLLGIIGDAAANSDFPSDAAELLAAWRNRQYGRLRSAIEEGQRRGYFRDDIDPATPAAVGLAAALGVGALDRAGDGLPVGNLLSDYCAWR